MLKRVEGIFAEAERTSIGDTVSDPKVAVTSKVRVGAHAVATGAHAAEAAAVSTAEAIGESEAFGHLKEGAKKGAAVASDSIPAVAEKATRVTKGWTDKLKK